VTWPLPLIGYDRRTTRPARAKNVETMRTHRGKERGKASDTQHAIYHTRGLACVTCGSLCCTATNSDPHGAIFAGFSGRRQGKVRPGRANRPGSFGLLSALPE